MAGNPSLSLSMTQELSLDGETCGPRFMRCKDDRRMPKMSSYRYGGGLYLVLQRSSQFSRDIAGEPRSRFLGEENDDSCSSGDGGLQASWGSLIGSWLVYVHFLSVNFLLATSLTASLVGSP